MILILNSYVECVEEAFVYWIPESEMDDSELPDVEGFLQEEFPHWVKSDVYDETVDLVIFRRGVQKDFELQYDFDGDGVMDTGEDFMALVEERNVALAFMGRSDWTEMDRYGLHTEAGTCSTQQHVSFHPLEIDSVHPTLTEGFGSSQEIFVALEPSTQYKLATYDPTTVWDVVAWTGTISQCHTKTMLTHEVRPYIGLPWQGDYNTVLSEEGRALMKNAFSWLTEGGNQAICGGLYTNPTLPFYRKCYNHGCAIHSSQSIGLGTTCNEVCQNGAEGMTCKRVEGPCYGDCIDDGMWHNDQFCSSTIINWMYDQCDTELTGGRICECMQDPDQQNNRRFLAKELEESISQSDIADGLEYQSHMPVLWILATFGLVFLCAYGYKRKIPLNTDCTEYKMQIIYK